MPQSLSGTAFHSPPQPLLMQEPVMQDSLKSALITTHAVELKEQLDKQDIPSEMLLDLLAHACEKGSAFESKKVLVCHKDFSTGAVFGPQQETALDLAVKYDDVALSKHILEKGADPERYKARLRSDAMRDVLVYACRRNKLYPQGEVLTNGTDLDHALQGGAHAEAIAILKSEMDGKTIPQTWRDAVKENRSDILRAILLLGHADRDRSFRLLQDENDKIVDAGVIEVMKEISYFSPQRKALKSLNLLATFPGTENEIQCRHFAVHQQEVQASDPALKFDYAQFKDLATIAKHVKPDTEQKYARLRAQATETHLVDNREFGAFLAAQFEAMEADNKTGKLILIESTVHSMNLRLRIKDKNGQKVYVATFFDPNTTTSDIRHASASLKTFESRDVGTYMTDDACVKDCYPEPKGVSMAYVRPAATERQATALSLQGVDNRMLTNCIDDKEVAGIVVWHLLSRGFAGNLRQLKEEIASRPEAEKIALLSEKNDNGVTGFNMAMQDGHTDAVNAYRELLHLVPENARAELVAAKTGSNGAPGLLMALQNGHANTINAYAELLPLIPENARAELVAAKKTDGVSGMDAILLRVDDNDLDHTIEAYGKLLSLIPQKARYDLLAAQMNGMLSLKSALKDGDPKTVSRYITLINNTAATLSKDQRAALLKDVRQSHAFQIPMFSRWQNQNYYNRMKEKHPELYKEFKAMENALKT